MKWCTLVLFAAMPLAAQDSPLVAAAKRSRQAKKATIVITNETLVRSGVHLTTTTAQPSLSGLPQAAPVEPRRAPEQRAAAINQPPSSPRDDAEVNELDDPSRGDLGYCPTCLPILEPVSPTLPVVKAELSANPPHEAERVPAPVVPPQVPKP